MNSPDQMINRSSALRTKS